MTTTADARAEAPHEERDRPRRLRWVVASLVLVVVLWFLVAGVAGLWAASQLQGGRSAMIDARASIADGDVDAATSELSVAEARFGNADRALGGLLFAPARWIPPLSWSGQTAAALAASGHEVADAGLDTVGVLDELPDGLGSFAPQDGALPIEPLLVAAGPLGEARDRLQSAEARVEEAPADGLVGPVAEARTEFLDLLGDVQPGVETGAALSEVLPAFLGADEPRRYLFGAATPGELRGTGGFIGAITELEIDEGALSFGEFEAANNLQELPPDEVPAPSEEYAARWDQFGGAGSFRSFNATPHFPWAAEALAGLYERDAGTAVDGVIVADPFALQALLEIAGPVEAPGVGEIDADSVVEIVATESYGDITDPDERKRLLGSVASSALVGFLEGGAGSDPLPAAESLAEAAASGHLTVWSTDEREQSAFATADIDGALGEPEGDSLAVSLNNNSNHKGDAFLSTDTTYEVTLEPDGQASADLRLVLENNLPTQGLPGYVTGPNMQGMEAGDARWVVSAYCAAGCERGETDRDVGDFPFTRQVERGHQALSTRARLASGQAERLSVAWTNPDAWEPSPSGGTYQLAVRQQNRLEPSPTTVLVHPPDDLEFAEASAGDIADGSLRWEPEQTNSTQLLEVRLGGDDARVGPLGYLRELLGRPVTGRGGTG